MSLLTAGRTTSCSTTCSGGVEKIWLANIGDIDSYTEDATGVTALTMVATKVFYEFEILSETANFTENVSVENCSVLVEQALESIWRCRNITDRNLIEDLANNCCGMAVIHKEATGTLWIWGFRDNEEAKLGTAAGSTGTAFSDPNQEVVTINARAKQKATVWTLGEGSIPV